MSSTNTDEKLVESEETKVLKSQALDVAHELETLKQFSTEELKKVWDRHEFNQDLDLASFGVFLHSILQIPADSSLIPRLYELADTNKDGVVSFTEVVSLFTVLSVGDEQSKLQMLFNLFDLNGDGQVTQAEFAHVVETFWSYSRALGLVRFAAEEARIYGAEVFAKRVFDELDKNHDGFLTLEEYLTATRRYVRFGVPQILETQTGGHVGAFKISQPGQIMKKTGPVERNFYSTIMGATPGLSPFCPTFFGLHHEDGVDSVVMEDLCRGYAKPSILDLKMGTSSIGEDAPAHKIEAMQKKDLGTTTITLGMRFTGMRVWNAATQTFDRYNKTWGRAIQPEDFDAALLSFFGTDTSAHRGLISKFLGRLKEIHAWMSTQRYLRFYSSSLLFIYDGGDHAQEVRLKMIDFAHVHPIQDGGLDEKYLIGLNNLIQKFESFLSQ